MPLEINGCWRKDADMETRRVICHGTHGSKPLFPGDVWTQSVICGYCRKHIGLMDEVCPHCGAKLVGQVNDDEEAR